MLQIVHFKVRFYINFYRSLRIFFLFFFIKTGKTSMIFEFFIAELGYALVSKKI